MKEQVTWRDLYFWGVGLVSLWAIDVAVPHVRATEGLSVIAALLFSVSLLALPASWECFKSRWGGVDKTHARINVRKREAIMRHKLVFERYNGYYWAVPTCAVYNSSRYDWDVCLDCAANGLPVSFWKRLPAESFIRTANDKIESGKEDTSN